MAVEPATNETQAQDMQAHVRDYSGFIKLFKYGAIASFITGMLVMFIIA
jgi:hypothetical protein